MRKMGLLLLTVLSMMLQGAFGIRFVIDREECLSHNVEFDGDTVHVSFVVIKTDNSWNYGGEGVDLVVIFLLIVISFGKFVTFSGFCYFQISLFMFAILNFPRFIDIHIMILATCL